MAVAIASGRTLRKLLKRVSLKLFLNLCKKGKGYRSLLFSAPPFPDSWNSVKQFDKTRLKLRKKLNQMKLHQLRDVLIDSLRSFQDGLFTVL